MLRNLFIPAAALCLACGASAQDTQPATAPADEPAAQAAASSPEAQAEPAVVVTESGLQYIDRIIGEGEPAAVGDMVTVHYTGTLEDGTQFDTSRGRGPFSLTIGQGRVIQGWEEGLQGMRVGGQRQLIIPPDLGYGARGAGNVIPPNATLTFDIELLEIR